MIKENGDKRRIEKMHLSVLQQRLQYGKTVAKLVDKSRDGKYENAINCHSPVCVMDSREFFSWKNKICTETVAKGAPPRSP